MTPLDAVINALETGLIGIGALYFWVFFIASDDLLTDMGKGAKYAPRNFIRKLGESKEESQ